MKAQFAMEYLMVVGFSLAILVPAIAILYNEYTNSQTQVDVEHLSTVAREIIFQAEKIYYQGAPSQTQVEVFFPESIDMVKLGYEESSPGVGESHLSFAIHSTDVTIDASTPLVVLEDTTRPFKTFRGTHTLRLTAFDPNGTIAYSQGGVIVSDVS